jgi:transcriptional regulator with XRE-family HTH domain
MGSHLRQVAEARRTAARLVREAAEEVRRARTTAGMSQAQVAARLGWSRQRLGRIEAGRAARVPAADLAVLAAVVGLRLQLRAFPAGPPLRDVGQLAVTHRLRDRISPTWRLSLEVPVRIPGDLRAFDLLLREPHAGATVCVEVITRLTDAQAQLRAVHLKWRDGAPHGARLVVILGDTPGNRRALAVVRELLRDDLPLDGRAVLAGLREGRDPGGNGIALV